MLYFIGLTLMVAGGILTLPLPVAIIFDEASLIPGFVIPAIFALVLGYFMFREFEHEDLNYGKAMVVAALAWLLISFFSSLPIFYGTKLGPISSYFEAMSGFTTTGLTMLVHEAQFPHTILFWRSFMQWVGGIGIVVLFLSAIFGTGKIAKRLFLAEGGGGRVHPGEQSPEATVRAMTRATWKIYVLYTFLAVLLLYFAGMPLWESINHAMTALGTGGFGVKSDSFASYGIPVLIATLFPMILGATSFATHRRVIDGNWKSFFESYEFKLLIILIATSTLVLGIEVGWVDGIFSSVSAQTGTGFSSVDLIKGPAWGPLEKSILVFQMIIEGGFGSTAGGIKLIRTVVLIMALHWLVKRALLPDRAVVPFKLGDKTFPEDQILQTAVFAFIYILVLGIGSMVTMAAIPGESAINCIFDSVSAQGTVGLSTGITGPSMPSVVKITYILQMWIGRLEVIPAVAFASYFIGKIPRRREPF